MILGTGIDLVDVDRVRASLSRHGSRFLEKFLRPEELEYCRQHKDPALPAAARWAAKEAVAKAFGTGFGAKLGWADIEVTKNELGTPIVELHGKARDLMEKRAATMIHISLTHERNFAAAFAVLER